MKDIDMLLEDILNASWERASSYEENEMISTMIEFISNKDKEDFLADHIIQSGDAVSQVDHSDLKEDYQNLLERTKDYPETETLTQQIELDQVIQDFKIKHKLR